MASRLYAARLRPLISPGADAVSHWTTAPDVGPFPEVVGPYHPHCTGDGMMPGSRAEWASGGPSRPSARGQSTTCASQQSWVRCFAPEPLEHHKATRA